MEERGGGTGLTDRLKGIEKESERWGEDKLRKSERRWKERKTERFFPSEYNDH